MYTQWSYKSRSNIFTPCPKLSQRLASYAWRPRQDAARAAGRSFGRQVKQGAECSVLRSPLPARRGDPVQRSKGHAGEVLRDVAPCLFLMQAFQRSGERFCRFIHTSPLSGVALDSTMSQVCDKTAGLFARSAKRSFWRVREQARLLAVGGRERG